MKGYQFFIIYSYLFVSFVFNAIYHYEVMKELEMNIDSSVFGTLDSSQYPECQTDMKMSSAWTPELMYLNGVWTAGCVAEARRQLKGE